MRFRRKRSERAEDVEEADGPEVAEEPAPAAEEAAAESTMQGPFDYDQVDVPEDVYVDLGSLLIQPHEGAEVRMQVDEETGTVLALVLMAEEAALEVRAFAAPRHGDLWSDTRREIAADAAQRGGTADERSGPFGPELYCELPVTLEDGQTGVQPSRVIGVNGPRWFLRATLLGRPAVDPDAAGEWEEAVRAVVVRRDQTPRPPGEALPLSLPDSARRVD